MRLFTRLVHTDVRDHLRALLRETAQSVAVVTARLPSDVLHGATLSSFTSIALDPHPLVAFSLRIPSRMASAIDGSSPFIVNVLSAAQPHLAERFARPDVYPHPFSDPSVRYTVRDGIPILSGTLGALVCRLVTPPLSLAYEGGSAASELFIARVLSVEHVEQGDDECKLPLVYHRRQYTTVRDTRVDVDTKTHVI